MKYGRDAILSPFYSLTAALLLVGCLPTDSSVAQPGPAVSQQQTYSYENDIKPILDQKCIACHACFDSPCQLTLTSAEGLMRGATEKGIYSGTRFTNADPTRLFIDAHGQEQWRQKGFYSMFNERGGGDANNLERSVFFKMIELGKNNPLPANSPVPEDIPLGLYRANACATIDQFDAYAKRQPLQGMPLAITGLSDKEYETLKQWILEGSVIDTKPRSASDAERQQVDDWESYLNRDGLRNQLVARYLYEHLFPSHLYFPDIESGRFYELVRSKTPPGKPIEVIATLRPHDEPGPEFYYRLRPVDSTLVHKTHLPYPLGEAKLARFDALFFSGDWKVDKLPGYTRANNVNPLATFQDIPAEARYRFLLDNAHYFIETFIRGPVCAGQVATNVIRDQFFVMFQDPKSDLSVTDARYMDAILPHMELVPQKEGLLAMYPDWLERADEMNVYNGMRGDAYKAAQPLGPALSDIWDGDGHNENAALTVFRNYDNAMVSKGFVGAISPTVWVMDYPLLERTFYLLVVNYNVFGSVATQAETRLYFDLMRANGENNFLHFMPPGVRTAMRDSWYLGSEAETKVTKTYQIVNEAMPVQIDYKTMDPKAEFINLVIQRLGAAAGAPDVLNRCEAQPCYSEGASAIEQRIEASLQALASTPASEKGARFVDFMPDEAFLRVSTDKAGGGYAYTLIRNKVHSNVAFMFDETERRRPELDTLTVYPGLLGSYVNYMFHVPAQDIEKFTEAMQAVASAKDFSNLAREYGLPRSHPEIWDNFQWFFEYMQATAPLEAGIYDLNRYKKVSELISDKQG
ncbi:MAG: fatty acid cis/trans isomerase [Pseudomonadota bacterium]